MNKIKLLLALLAVSFFLGCEKPTVPPPVAVNYPGAIATVTFWPMPHYRSMRETYVVRKVAQCASGLYLTTVDETKICFSPGSTYRIVYH